MIVLLFFSPAHAQQKECDKVGALIKTLMTRDGLGYLADGISEEGQVYMWLISRKTGKWAQISVQRNLTACVEMRGVDWHFAAGG